MAEQMTREESISTRKIWGIGLSRTGTRSLHHALEILGYSAAHYPDPTPMFQGDFSTLDAVDAAMDIPIAHFFKTLDRLYPKSRFILTVRQPLEWLESINRYFATKSIHNRPERAKRMRLAVYGALEPTPSQLLDVYRAHLTRVGTYFANRPDDLLILDIPAGQGWETLCPFLEQPIPHTPFPHAHNHLSNKMHAQS